MTSFRLLIMTAFLLSTSCASILAPLVKPNVEQGEAALHAGAYQIDADHAALIFHVDHMEFSQFAGRFNRFTASLDFDDENASTATVSAEIDIASLDVANDDFANTLIGPQWFDAEKFPFATFVSEGITITGDNQGTMTGPLTLHGVTNPVTLNIVFNGGGRDRLRGAYVVGFSATGVISRKAFGIDRFGSLVGDDINIEIQAEFTKR